ncbi:MAG: tetratricopeptide repeat protein [Spirochaetaceae bacterium]|jgi:tetratricopeptide (TPR) repeat protein|nr:tetratricopeptide repeat protein [Spirochaetaceae bacterium]
MIKRLFLVPFFFINLSLFAQNTGAGVLAMQNYQYGRNAEARNGMTQDTIRYYNEAIRLATDEITRGVANIDTYAALTQTYNRLGQIQPQRYSDVITYGTQGLRLRNDWRIVEIMGEAYFYLNNYTASLNSLQRYVNALPQGERASVAYFFIGEIYRLQEKFRKADIAYTTALQLESSSPLWWYRLGSVREALNENQAAIEAYNEVIRRDPSFRDTRDRLARLRS